MERPYQRPAPGPREVRAPQHPGEGGGEADAAGAPAHTHTKGTRGLSYCTPNKTKYSSNGSFGLNITKVSITTHLQTINHTLRYSFRHGPETANETVINTLLTDSYEPNLLQHMTASSAKFLGYHCHKIPNINPSLLNQLPAHTPTEIAFTYYQSATDPPTYSTTQNTQHPKGTIIWHLGTLDHPNSYKTTATFPDMTVQITNNNRFRLPTNTTNNPRAIAIPTNPPNPPDTTSFPYAFSSSHFSPSFVQFTLVHNIPPPKLDHLHFLGCHDLRQALLTYPTATVCYTDGSDDQKNDRPSGSAATFNTAPPITICNTSPIKGSYPAEIFAIILTTLLRSLPTLLQPIIFAIDNLSVCSTLQLIQQTEFNTATASSNPFCLWYSHIWTFLHSSPLHIIFTWIKGHAVFPCNDYSDAISKWASNNINYPPRSQQPNSTYVIYHQCTPLPGKVSLKSFKHLLPAYCHNNIHLSMSRDFYSHTSWSSRLPFKWVNGLYICTGYQRHYIPNQYPCPKCLQKHPLDPITVIAECTATAHRRQPIINAWPSPFNDLISDWWTTATLGDCRNFIRTLIPNPLSNLLRLPPPALTYTQHR